MAVRRKRKLLSQQEAEAMLRRRCSMAGRAGSAMANALIAMIGALDVKERDAFARTLMEDVRDMNRRDGITAQKKGA